MITKVKEINQISRYFDKIFFVKPKIINHDENI